MISNGIFTTNNYTTKIYFNQVPAPFAKCGKRVSFFGKMAFFSVQHSK